ncbi:hypothetical protein SAY87_015591 [Trapa incisa]|uniref:Protein FLX-like 3 n=1 Tax=Trapa incisa TaxID=236973 RepID=A0AAN7LDH0_9MYRT|nr:hypothetical protein SAY87_015591 [Trapa incisa]
MEGRNRTGRRPETLREFWDGPPPPFLSQGPGPLRSVHPATLEEELEIKHREIQRIISENRAIIDENTLLHRDLRAAKDEIHRVGQVIPKIRAEKESRKRELIENKVKLEAQLRASEPVRKEVVQLRNEVQKLNSLRQELSAKVQNLTKDATRLQAENQQLIPMRADIDGLRKELYEARRILEFEKKAHEEQAEQKDAMEKNLISMAREIEKLRAEQVNTERMAHGFGIGGYGMINGSPEMRYQGSRYGDGYGISWGHQDKRARH